MKKIILAIFGIVFTSVLFTQSSYADTNPSITFNSGTSVSNSVSWFSDCDATCFSQYSYLKITSSSAPISDFYSGIRVYFISATTHNVSSQGYIDLSTSVSYYKIDDVPIERISFAQNTTPPYSFTAELVEDIGGSSVPAECPDPVIPDCEEPFIVRLFEGSFWNVATAIIALVVPILALFLVFRLIHGLIYGKGV